MIFPIANMIKIYIHILSKLFENNFGYSNKIVSDYVWNVAIVLELQYSCMDDSNCVNPVVDRQEGVVLRSVYPYSIAAQVAG